MLLYHSSHLPSSLLRKLWFHHSPSDSCRHHGITASRHHVSHLLPLTPFLLLIITLTPLNTLIPALSDNPWSRLTYSFRHANILHAGINVFVFYQIVRNFRISAARLAVAYLIAVLVPPMFITAPAVGLSVIIYALFGLIVPFVATAKRKQYITSVLVFIIPQVIIPHFAWHLHIYAFLTALLLIVPSLKE